MAPTEKALERRYATTCPCGGDIFERTYNALVEPMVPIWRCDNCGAETPRTSPHRKSNHTKAIEAYLAISGKWKPLDAALESLIASGKAMGGASLVHSSTFNHHLGQLLGVEKPTNFQVRYHTKMAKEDMDKAQAFIKERQ